MASPALLLKIISQDHNIGIEVSLCIIPFYNLSLCQISSKSIKYLLSQFVTKIQIFPVFNISIDIIYIFFILFYLNQKTYYLLYLLPLCQKALNYISQKPFHLSMVYLYCSLSETQASNYDG